jgi:hypothetical protein
MMTESGGGNPPDAVVPVSSHQRIAAQIFSEHSMNL